MASAQPKSHVVKPVNENIIHADREEDGPLWRSPPPQTLLQTHHTFSVSGSDPSHRLRLLCVQE